MLLPPLPPPYQCWADSSRECAGLRQKHCFLRVLAGGMSNLEIGGHRGVMKLDSACGHSEVFFADTGVDVDFGFYHWLPSRPPASRFARLQAPRCLLSELVAMAPHLEPREFYHSPRTGRPSQILNGSGKSRPTTAMAMARSLAQAQNRIDSYFVDPESY